MTKNLKDPIVTSYDPKPIPLRKFDWIATRKSYEPPMPVGYGSTEAEAIADLLTEEGGEDPEDSIDGG